ncbi:MAG: 4-hydroxy-2-oxovalerate aldolase [Candidatus Handelsmanbacteria bacterium]|nr:4-hydroxy-2-oxovalerate aldolase [Candidatus Handelsmanbacteria bacterium]
MRKSKLLAKLRASQTARICSMGHFLPFYVRYAAHFKYDAIWFDLEHRAFDPREVQAVLALCHAYDIDCMLRPSSTERNHLYRHLEDGATGFLVPFVDTPQIAQHLINAAKYPPTGKRGIDGAGLDADFGIDAWREGSTYYEDANRETFIVAQIETPEGLENTEAIAALPGIDALFVGPSDLGHRLAVSNSGLSLEKAIAKVAAACDRHQKAWGLPAGSPADLKRYQQMGSRLAIWGGDFSLINVLKTCSEQLDEAVGT